MIIVDYRKGYEVTMYKACIFDLDGTLADTLDSMAYVTNIIMEKFGLKTLPVDNFRYYSGEGANMLDSPRA